MNYKELLTEKTGLLVVDVQNDFCPGGKLAIREGDAVVPELNAWIEEALRGGGRLYFSRDWHPKRHMSFAAEGGQWPEHCVQDTGGAAFHPDLLVPEEALVITKGVRLDKDQYSAFDETGLAVQLRRDNVDALVVGGLALDVCVKATVLDALKAGFRTVVPVRATRPVTEQGGREALDEMRAAGAIIKED